MQGQSGKFVIACFIVAILSISGCGTVTQPIQSYRNFEQPLGTTLSTGVGGLIFHMKKTADLPNALGGKDIWGGKVDKGYAEMKLAGIEGSILILEIVDTNLQATETAFDRNMMYKAYKVVTGDKSDNKQEQAKPNVVRFDFAQQKEIVISGVKVTFSEVQPYNVKYSLQDIQP